MENPTIESIINFLIDQLQSTEEVEVIRPLQDMFIAECEKRGIELNEGNNYYWTKYYFL